MTKGSVTKFIREECLAYGRGVWWMKFSSNLWRRCYVRYQTVTERERGTIVELRRCLHCEPEEVILLGVYMCASDTEEEEAFSDAFSV